MKRPHLALMDEVRITRDGESAVIEFVEANTSMTHLKVGPEIEHMTDQWTTRGDVLRCVISDGGPDNEPIIYIDDRELSWREFGHLLTTYAGWGMRVVFVPDDELERGTADRDPRARREAVAVKNALRRPCDRAEQAQALVRADSKPVHRSLRDCGCATS